MTSDKKKEKGVAVFLWVEKERDRRIATANPEQKRSFSRVKVVSSLLLLFQRSRKGTSGKN